MLLGITYLIMLIYISLPSLSTRSKPRRFILNWLVACFSRSQASLRSPKAKSSLLVCFRQHRRVGSLFSSNLSSGVQISIPEIHHKGLLFI
ncbi:hypothetical protein C8J56DRAFT_923134 [Mycena floridula]|nr:hypothetical protein C8J56DRAFT_923134 [Mycena floridula]